MHRERNHAAEEQDDVKAHQARKQHCGHDQRTLKQHAEDRYKPAFACTCGTGQRQKADREVENRLQGDEVDHAESAEAERTVDEEGDYKLHAQQNNIRKQLADQKPRMLAKHLGTLLVKGNLLVDARLNSFWALDNFDFGHKTNRPVDGAVNKALREHCKQQKQDEPDIDDCAKEQKPEKRAEIIENQACAKRKQQRGNQQHDDLMRRVHQQQRKRSVRNFHAVSQHVVKLHRLSCRTRGRDGRIVLADKSEPDTADQ
ncbi:hypothetical protein SDC9_158571 [bioreactor metagenome]|uniref:Uncharacterized protein n=1 Tax=bioreactor metagenome TaxID=1076179 RepID=A0A645FBG6_9ZZZZ